MKNRGMFWMPASTRPLTPAFDSSNDLRSCNRLNSH